MEHDQEPPKTRPKVRLAPFSVYEDLLFIGILAVGIYAVILYFSGTRGTGLVISIIVGVLSIPFYALFDWFFHPHPDDLEKEKNKNSFSHAKQADDRASFDPSIKE